ncbi:MAG: efflux RND transporter periplasmic adaptor subunit [Leptospiraceae bacterium]|nr:efflux RND transporter periplasmic adaptor subunit [Leptospiraceae bacterium]MCP5513253.1 efflux RND transporter periplasmic adaptor subunit [Leptospiraceae bacterium]
MNELLKKNKYIFLVGFLLLSAFAFFMGKYLKKTGVEAPQETVQELPDSITLSEDLYKKFSIRTVDLVRKVYNRPLVLVGEIAADPDRVAQISARISGRITKVYFKEGSTIKKNETIIEMESPDASRVRSDYLSSYSKYLVAEKKLKRVQELSRLRMSSEQELINAESEEKIMGAELSSAKSSLYVQGIPIPDMKNLNEYSLGKIQIRSPIQGIALSRTAIPGTQVTPSDTLGVIADINLVWFEVKVFEKDLSKIQMNSSATIELNAVPEKKFLGRVENIGNQVDPASRTINARIVLNNTDHQAKIGLFGKAKIDYEKGDVLTIPNNSVFDWDNKKFCFLELKPMNYKIVEIKIEESSDGNEIEVLSGLNEGDRIVTEGVFSLKSIYLKSTFGED